MPRSRATRCRTVLAGAVLACAGLSLAAGCGDQDSAGPADSPAGDATHAPSGTSAPAPTATPTREPTVPPSGALQKVRVVGEVVQVGDCVVVEDDNAVTWTISGATGLVVGDRVTVTGTPDLTATGCGGPLVDAVRVTVQPANGAG
jgi:hypothetical protein